jgi:hypothetical protein
MVIGPGIQVKAVEGDPLRSDWNDGHARAHLSVEAVLVHAEVRRRISQTDEAGRDVIAGGLSVGTAGAVLKTMLDR